MRSLIFKSNLNAIEYNKSVIREFQKIVSPLLVNFPFSYLMYIRFFKDGRYLVLCNDLKPVKLYLDHNLSNHKVFLQEFTTIRKNSTHKFLWPIHNHHKYAGLFMLYEHNIWHGMNVTHNMEDYLETFVFFPKKECDQVLDLYLNHFYILERFILYFKSKARYIINCSDQQIFAYSSFYKKEMNNLNIENNCLIDYKNDFFNATDINKIYLNGEDMYIPRKGCECLYYLSLGKSMKETSDILSISHRTVERHLQKIKAKFKLNYSHQLISLCEQYGIDKLHLKNFSH